MNEFDTDTGKFPMRVGERLRIAREAKGLTLDEVAFESRVPSRHLGAIESGDFTKLPAAPYSAGFIKSYARIVGLDEAELSRGFRDELAMQDGGSPTSMTFEPADPSRLAPRVLAWVAALIALLIVAGYAVWRNNIAGGPDTRAQLAAGTTPEPEPVAPPPTAAAPQGPPPASVAPPPVAPPAAGGAVAITAIEPVWIRVYERAGTTLFMGELAAGQRYDLPGTAIDPLIRTGRAESLRVTVGAAEAPPIGPPARILRDVSLKPEALLARVAAPAAARGMAVTGRP